MKRKSLLFALLVALFMPWAAQAQTRETLTFDFEDQTIPSTWTNDATYPWVVTDAAANAGTYSIKSGNSGVNNSTSTITATYTFAGEGSISFAVRCSSEQTNPTYDWDYGTFYIDGVQQGGRIINSTTFSALSYDVEAGEHTFMWTYKKDGSVGSNDDCLYVDDIVIDLGVAASTPKPTGLAVSNILHNEATLSWTENGTATSWQLCINGDEDHPTTINTNPYTMTGLTPLTAYTVKVRSVGSDEYSAWSNVVNFTTTAQATAVGDSWSDNFEDGLNWDLINGTIANAWVRGTAANNGGSYGLYISNDNGTSNAYSHSAAIVYATKLLNFTEGKFEFAYDWKANGESSWDYLRVALVPASVTLTAGTTPSGFSSSGLPTGWIALDGGSQLQGVTSWQSKSLAINVTAGNYYLVMAWKNDGSGGTQPPAAVDNVSITRMACPYDVTGLAVSNIATTTADIAWTNGDPGEWQVATKTGDGEWITLPNTYTTNSATLTGLTAATTYQVRVRAYCNANDQGAWCDAITFTTECEAIDLSLQDYSENFDSYTAGTGVLPVCWNRINEGTSYTTYPYIYGYNAHSTSNCLYFYTYGTSGSDQYAILPAMENMEGKQITLWAKGYNVGNTFKIGMMTDPADATTFEEIAEQTLTTSYEEYSFILGRGNYVAIMMETPTSSTTKGVYIDDITIADVPACVKPSDLTFVSATTNSATLSWTNGADTQTAWQIAYSTDPAFNPDEVTPVDVTSNPGTINNLTAATTYYAYVRANCGNNGYSDWSYAYCMFNTECDAITISDEGWTENFNSYTAGATSTSTPSAYPNDVLPTCWQFLNRSETSGTYPQVFLSSYSSYVVSGNCLFFKSSSSTPMYAILPEFTEDIANLQLTFTYRNEGVSASNGTLIVGYMTDPTDATTFIAKHTCEQTTTLTEQEVLFTDAPARSYIAFMYQGGSANNYYLSIDNVSVNYPPTCVKPSNLVFVSSTTTEATLSWTNGAEGQTAWQIAYSTDPAFDPNEVTPTNVTSNPGIISGLTAATTYYAYVRANCGNDDYSDWSSAYVQFDTECDVIVVDATHPFTEGFDGITSGIPVCWDNSEGTTSDASYRWNYYATGYKGHCVRFNSYNNSADNTNFLKTPVMNLPQEGENLQLSFWYKNPAGGDFSVYISTDGGDTYTTALASDLTDQSEWTKKDISLREYAGNENVVIVFAGTSNWGYNDAYIYLDEVFVGMPFTKTIAAVGEENWEGGRGGYYLIASPLADAVDPTTITDMTTGDYDLYSFDQTAVAEEWQNYRASAFNLVNGQGYLYASKNGVTLTFTGVPGTNGEVTLEKAGSGDWDGWNLVGNPFGVDAYITKPFYTLENSDTYTENTVGTAIQPMQGLLVVADNDGENLIFSTEAPTGNKTAKLNMNLRRGDKQLDNAILVFGGNQQLGKMTFRANSSKIYMPVEGKDYAIVSTESNMGEMPVSFKAENNGSYTLSFSAEEVSFAYLHLIDNLTGIETDLLANPSYSFEASTTDYASRFKLVFATGSNGNDDNFAFFSNGSFVINNEGNATLQVVDVTGRIIKSESINGCANVNVNAAPGVYMIRLVNGDNVKVQKVVVR